ncbi:MAG: signal recognition particle-docking protein FtsY [Ilumatobacteraceae bacterium]
MTWIYLVLALAVVAFGIGVVVVNRKRSAGAITPPRTAPRTPIKPSGSIAIKPADRAGHPPAPGPPAAGGVDTIDRDEPSVAAEHVDEAPGDESVAEQPEFAERPRFRDRMAKSRAAFVGAFSGVRGRKGITDETWDDLEEALLKADVGVHVTDALLSDLRARVKAKEITEPGPLLDALRADMVGRLDGADRELHFEPGDSDSPNVWLFVGVNGVGKTTTIGKLGKVQADLGRSVLMAAGDTFRAAAAEQLGMWAERSGAELVRGSEGGDPSSVIFDGVERASARGIDLVLADTAGRLHNKTNLMEELRKVRRVAGKGKGRVTETLLVIDATTGQNGLTQAREFGNTTEVTGVVLTKLDGSAKGGIVFAIETELGLPIKLVGLGETINDLIPFDPEEFIAALFE